MQWPPALPLSTPTFHPCSIDWTCPAPRLLACEFGLFTWNPIHEDEYARQHVRLHGRAPPVSFAHFLATRTPASAQVMMGVDGRQVEMLFVKLSNDLVAPVVGIELIPCHQYGRGREEGEAVDVRDRPSTLMPLRGE